ncbi:MAG: hypothetical protein RSG22_15495 [Comamonas sp.]
MNRAAVLPPTKAYSRKQIHRRRLQLTAIAIVTWVAIVIGTFAATCMVIDQCAEQLFSVGFKP